MLNLMGKEFGKLIVLERIVKNKWNQFLWLCQCDCGQKIIIRGSSLKDGNTKSCGCLQKEIVTRHGHNTRIEKSKIYIVWDHMVQRCINSNNKRYIDYGGRGIKVCKRWMKFENFLKDMGEAPEGLQLDRINNNKGYCKSNCQWSTREEQMRNTRKNHLETYNNKMF